MKSGELVLLLSKDESYLVKIREGSFHTKSGVINLSELKGRKYGEVIRTHLNKEFVVVKPTTLDILERGIKRVPQIMMPKDIVMILAYTGIGKNSVIIDAGTGSGFTSIFLANYLIKGKVVTYEKDKRFIRIAKENIKLSGLKNIELRERDISKGILEKNVDLITLDLKNPEKIIPRAYKALKSGGWLVIYSPNIEQVIAIYEEINKKSFCDVKTIENIIREWQVEKTTRPKTMGIMHTGFLTFARKVS